MGFENMEHLEKVKKQFDRQSSVFNTEGYALSSKEYLEWAVSKLPLNSQMEALDVASGTGLLSLALSPLVKTVTAIDATEAMIAKAKEAARQKDIQNIIFEKGLAQSLPFSDNRFDITTCRLAFHHFLELDKAFDEIIRVTKTGGTIAIMDLISSEDKEIAKRYNHYEILRDDSHTYALSEREMLDLFQKHSVTVLNHYSMDVEMSLESWMNLTGTNDTNRRIILDAVHADLEGGEKTGMRPYIGKDREIKFLHRWMLTIGKK